MLTTDLSGSTDRCDINLPVNPFVSNQYHFGMLLGVADLEADQAYHRGKTWMHNAWMHGSGTIWGLEVELRPEGNEIAVSPGLAIDGHGRELQVANTMCVNIVRWFEERRPEDFEFEEQDGLTTFTVHVELCHDSCLDRPVPSISEPCDDASLDTAYSRAVERGLPRIVAGPAPAPRQDRYPLLRQFFGQVPAVSELVVDAIAEVAAADVADRAAVCVRWFRRFSAADTMALRPDEGASIWSPTAGDGCVPLADLVIHLQEVDGVMTLVVDDDEASVVDNFVRTSHVRTQTIQELLCHNPF